MKHFNKVGFAGDINKPIPRWAADENELNKIKIWQTTEMNPDLVFGVLRPRKIANNI
jgi:hypothetical protein